MYVASGILLASTVFNSMIHFQKKKNHYYHPYNTDINQRFHIFEINSTTVYNSFYLELLNFIQSINLT